MQYANSSYFFEISREAHLDNGLQGRLLCLKDFLKKCLLLPFALVFKACKTAARIIGIVLAVNLLLVTLGSSSSIRKLFIRSMSGLAKDLADWVLLPLAFISCSFRLLAGLVLHPNIYFNALA